MVNDERIEKQQRVRKQMAKPSSTHSGREGVAPTALLPEGAT